MGRCVFALWGLINERRRRELVEGLPQNILKNLDYLRQHFVHFESSLIKKKKAAKVKGKT